MIDKARPVLVLVALMWVIEGIDHLVQVQLDQYGIVARDLNGLVGIACAPFLHRDFAHLIANTAPLFLLGWLSNLASRGSFVGTTIEIMILAGLLTWGIADLGESGRTVHIGASSLVFGYFGLVVARAIFEFRLITLLLALLAAALYGGLIYGVLPGRQGISWEGHLSGLIAGVVLARVHASIRRSGNLSTTEPTDSAPATRRTSSEPRL